MRDWGRGEAVELDSDQCRRRTGRGVAHVGSRRSVSGRVATLFAAVSFTATLVAVAVSFVGGLPFPPLIAVAGALPFVSVVVGVNLAVSMFGSTRVRAASLALALVWFGFLAVDTGHGSLIPPGEDDVTVVSANLLLTNSSIDEAAATLERTGADIIVTLETTPSFRVALERRWSGSYEPVARGGLDADDIAIWSRVPVDVLSPVRVCDRLLPVVSVRQPGSSFTLSVVGVHLTSPARRSVVDAWRCELDALRAAAAPSDAVVLAGDFNASLNHAGLRNPRIGVLALHDAARASGELFEPTWPTIAGTGSPVAVALLDLDHVLVGGAGVSAYERFEVPGSDHAALKVSVGPLRQG